MTTPALGLFEGAAPRVRNAPPSAALLDLLRDRMIAELVRADDPFALADAIVLLPNRRAARALMDSFAARGGAALLPSIRPLGDLDDDPDVWGPDPASFDAQPAIDPLRRRLELAKLLRAKASAEGGADDPVLALATADELCKLLDAAAAAEDVDWARLPSLVADKDLAAHWARSAQFLEIIARYWPQRLALEGLMDPGERRTRLLHALADLWTREPPQIPIVIAGSTGSVGAVRRLMRVVSCLPRGVVVLPGLDGEFDDAAWNGIDEQHPQFALHQTVGALGVARGAIPTLVGAEETERTAARRALLREALAPAAITADWIARLEDAARPWGDRARFAAAATQDLLLCEAATEDEEASVAALALRQVLQTPGRTGALVTPDARLARRVAAKLQRWGIEAAVSAGAPLAATPPGLLLGLIAALAADESDPVALAALVQHPLTRLSGTDEARALIDAFLRGPRRYDDLAAMADAAGATGARERVTAAAPAIAALRAALAPLKTAIVDGEVTPNRLAEALEAVAKELCEVDQLWTGAAGNAAAEFLGKLYDHGDALGALTRVQIPRFLAALMAGKMVAPDADDDPRIAIWGPLEARMQRRDVIVLGGLNEGQWPAPPPDEPFLSRTLRKDLGLPAPDARIGLAAHDFAQLANAPRVILTRSQRIDGAPSVASRWLWRLEALVRAAGADLRRGDSADMIAWARGLDAPRVVMPAQPPSPKPAARNLRIRALSVTDVEKLVRDPYFIFAKRILRLAPKDAIGLYPGPAQRGSAVHDALERFQKRGDDDPDTLIALLDDALAAAGFAPERRAGDRARLAPAARVFTDWSAARRAAGMKSVLEVSGRLDLGAGVALTARADRIDLKPKGRADIIDYKTGAVPTDNMIKAGFSAQLLLEAAMLELGAFENTPTALADELIYWRFAASNFRPNIVATEQPSAEAGRAALAALKARLAYYDDPARAFFSQIKPQRVTDVGDYDHLARRQEWVDLGNGE